MEPVLVIDLFDEGANIASGVRQVAVGAALHLFGLQGLHEALRHRVVIRTRDSAHGYQDGADLEPGKGARYRELSRNP